MKALFVIIFGLLLAACDSTVTSNNCLRAELFQQCLSKVPKGPEITTYNDWAEVVQACESAAYYQSQRKYENIPKECK